MIGATEVVFLSPQSVVRSNLTFKKAIQKLWHWRVSSYSFCHDLFKLLFFKINFKT